MREEIKTELREAETVEQMFAILAKYYDLHNATVSLMYRNIFINNLTGFIEILNVKEKK